jgi:hypothetical protein
VEELIWRSQNENRVTGALLHGSFRPELLQSTAQTVWPADLKEVWDFCTITPLERSKELGTKAFFTAEEAAKYEQEESRRQNRDLIDPKQGGSLYRPL